MKSDMRKWLLGIATSIIIGIFMWWLTHSILARPELRIVDSHVSGCNPTVINVTVFNSGDKLAENCNIRVGLFIDHGGIFPSNYEDLKKRYKRFDVASSDHFFVAPNKQKQVSISYWPPKDSRCDMNAIYDGYKELGLWLGIELDSDQVSTTALARGATAIYIPSEKK
jgi:hypothetical protein